MKSNHPLLEQFFDLYASIKKEAEAEIRRRGEVDFSYLHRCQLEDMRNPLRHVS